LAGSASLSNRGFTYVAVSTSELKIQIAGNNYTVFDSYFLQSYLFYTPLWLHRLNNFKTIPSLLYFILIIITIG